MLQPCSCDLALLPTSKLSASSELHNTMEILETLGLRINRNEASKVTQSCTGITRGIRAEGEGGLGAQVYSSEAPQLS